MDLRIKEILQDKGLKQKDLADRLDCSPQQISHILSGKSTSNAMLKRVADALGVSFAELFMQPITSEPSFTAIIRDGGNYHIAYTKEKFLEIVRANYLES